MWAKALFKTTLLILVGSSLFPREAVSQEVLHHPRVAELEDHLKQTSTDFIRTRFPELPFFVTVMVDPLRRSPSGSLDSSEPLPWSSFQHDEVLDEWDDPSSSLYQLQNRVTRIHVEVSVPIQVRDHEIAEMREALIRNLRLIPARDLVVIERKEWALGKDLSPQIITWGGGIILALLLGLYLIQRLNVRKLSTAIGQVSSRGGGSEVPLQPVTSQSSTTEGRSQDGGSSGGSGLGSDVNFRDPIKTREIIFQKINDLVSSETFPLLEDLTEFEKFSKRSPQQFGALLLEFPIKSQRKVFSLGRSRDWFKAFAEPGNLGPECLDVIEKMQRVRPENINRSWEDLRIQAWRLGARGPQFLRSMAQEDAFNLLRSLPRFVSIPMAREAFPGAWGTLLDHDKETTVFNQEKIEKYYNQATEIVPKFSFKALESYRREKDLLDYLKVSSVEEERDIYRVLGDELISIRPPFYQLLEAEETDIRAVLSRFSLSDLALSMFNVPKHLRTKLESCFSEKQKFLYYEHLKQLDSKHPSLERVGLVRERVARSFQDVKSVVKLNSIEPEESPSEASEDTISMAS